MDNNKNEKQNSSWWEAHKPTRRRIVQLYCALLYNAHLRGFAQGSIFTGKTKGVCVPGLNCYSCPGAVGACPLGSLQNALGSLNKHIGFYVLGIILLYGMLLGRTVCGWLCPLGLIQELLNKIPTPKIQKSRFTRLLSYLKYVMLAVFAVFVPVYYGLAKGMQVPGFCKYICPAGTLEGAIGLLPKNLSWLSMLGPIFTRKFVIMAVIALVCVFCYRAFCRFLCPLGAIYGMFNRLSVIGVRVDTGRCNSCGSCVRSCKMDVRYVGDHECIHCGSCINNCHQGAISMKGEGFTSRTAVKAGMITLLVAALVWFNLLDPTLRGNSAKAEDPAESAQSGQTSQGEVTSGAEETFTSDAPVGYEVGCQLGDFEIECLDGSIFRLSDTRGKVTVINLWATYCGPCVGELPHFCELRREHEGDVEIIAVHANLTTEDVAAFVDANGWDIRFAVDDGNETVFGIVNGSLALPQTIVLNRRGEVVYNRVGSVTPELLAQLYEQASK